MQDATNSLQAAKAYSSLHQRERNRKRLLLPRQRLRDFQGIKRLGKGKRIVLISLDYENGLLGFLQQCRSDNCDLSGPIVVQGSKERRIAEDKKFYS